MIMTNLDHGTLEDTSSREITADELNQVTGGMGPVFLSRMSYPTVGLGDIRGESTDDR
jgi:bacteriocin-like protein